MVSVNSGSSFKAVRKTEKKNSMNKLSQSIVSISRKNRKKENVDFNSMFLFDLLQLCRLLFVYAIFPLFLI